jgi:hypothetical protein
MEGEREPPRAGLGLWFGAMCYLLVQLVVAVLGSAWEVLDDNVLVYLGLLLLSGVGLLVVGYRPRWLKETPLDWEHQQSKRGCAPGAPEWRVPHRVQSRTPKPVACLHISTPSEESRRADPRPHEPERQGYPPEAEGRPSHRGKAPTAFDEGHVFFDTFPGRNPRVRLQTRSE